jgi:tetratricopeptide (TPR) repeat protein
MRYTITLIVYFFSISLSIASVSYYQEALQSFEDDNFELSIKYLEKNIVFNPKSSESYVLLGKTYSALENNEKAKKYFKIAYTLIPENVELNYLLGEVSYNLGLIEEYAEYLSNLEILCTEKCEEIDQLKKLSTE